ncbi:MAG: ATP-binding protein, partial [Nitrospiraceae bacterium]|nr:ATP-binding protein [Nitrospiraceae bacterium]
MPLGGIPEKEFVNREEELCFLRRLAGLRRDGLAANVLLLGGRGSGKTELLKQLCREVFWEGREVVPFYYSFRTAALKSATFAKDYFTRFVKQYIAFVKKEPLLADDAGTPLRRLAPLLSSEGLQWLIDAADELEEHTDGGDLYGQVLSAISAPAAAAKRGGRPVLVMLDDFSASGRLYEARQGDSPGLVSLFEESMNNRLCPHIITGSPAAGLEAIFSDPALRRETERMRLLPLPEDAACDYFTGLLRKMQIPCERRAALLLAGRVRGNPLYLRNMAKAASKMKKKVFGEDDISECYCSDIAFGETAFYWTSVLAEGIPSRGLARTVLKLLMLRLDKPGMENAERLSRVLGVRDADLGTTLDLIEANGLGLCDDPVFDDFVRALFMKQIEGRSDDDIREALGKRFGEQTDDSRFEMVIPMTDQAELVAARAVEQIGRNLSLDQDLLNSIQLALVETCINAMEHSGSYERKIRLSVVSSAERLEIAIESPGRHFSLDSLKETPVEEKLAAGKKRGWGFTLIR